MISAQSFIAAARERGFGLWTGVPCSFLQPLINGVIGDDSLLYVAAANEGDAVGIAAGAQIGGLPAIVMLQNSGLGNAVNPLTSLTHTHRIPCLIIVTLRGDPEGAGDEPQHELMGRITTSMLELMEIPWAWFPSSEEDISVRLDEALAQIRSTSRPFCLVMRKGSVADNPAPVLPALQPARRQSLAPAARLQPTATRGQMLQAVQQACGDADLIVATTGYTGRELYALDDRANQLYLVGAMGCACSVGLGLALARPDRRVVVLDGDGALLMRMGALATLGFQRPHNLLHILLDNGMHESTGGQGTISHALDWSGIAACAGFEHCQDLDQPQQLAELLERDLVGATFVRACVVPGVPAGLPRPKVTPVDVTRRLRAHLDESPVNASAAADGLGA